ncbi:MAG: aromatic-ring-hydroxylating dioxygenase subunit beta [Alphaproteobacteria bacterium]
MDGTSAASTIRAIEEFLFLEARLLDEGRYQDWLDLFTPDAWYWVPIKPDQQSPHDTVSIIYDDRKALETRVRRLLHPAIHAQNPPSRTSRLVGNVVVESPDDGAGRMVVSSRLQMVEFRRDRQRLFAATVRHLLMPAGDTFRIGWKRVELVNSDGMHDGIVVPL